MIALLRARGADPHHPNNRARTPLQLARLIGDRDAAQFFTDLPHAAEHGPPKRRIPPIVGLIFRSAHASCAGVSESEYAFAPRSRRVSSRLPSNHR